MIKIDEYVYEVEEKDFKEVFKERPSDSNKGDYGYVGILSILQNRTSPISIIVLVLVLSCAIKFNYILVAPNAVTM